MHGLGQQPGHIRHHHEGDVELAPGLEPFPRGAVLEFRHIERLQLVGAFQPQGGGGEARVLGDVLQPHQHAEIAPLVRRQHGDAEHAFPAGIIAEREGRHEAVDPEAALVQPQPDRLGGLVFADHHIGFEQAEREVPPGVVVGIQPGQSGDEAVQPARQMRLEIRQQQRRSGNRPGQRRQSGQGTQGAVGGGVVTIRPVLAKRRERHHDLAGQAERGSLAFGRQPAVEQHLHRFHHRRPRRRRVGHTAFVGVEPGEEAAFVPPAAHVHQRRNLPARIAARRFQLDHLGAEIGEQLAAIGKRVAAADLGHPHPAQHRHGGYPSTTSG